MEGKKLIIFDKDGTLMDSSPGSFAAFEVLAREQGLTVEPRERWLDALCGSFGHNIKWLFHLTDDQAGPMALEFTKIYGRTEGYFDFVEYPDICDVVRELAGRYMLSVATMMFVDFAVMSFRAMDIDGCFITIQGSIKERWVTKQELIENCMSIAGVEPSEVVMIGDCDDDLESARKAGIDFIGVTYGYGFTPEDCEREGIPYAKSPRELLDIL